MLGRAKLVLLLPFFIPVLWKVLSTDRVVLIEQQDGTDFRYYPKNTPLWDKPTPDAPYRTFTEQIIREVGSGNGPYLDGTSEVIKINIPIIFAKIAILFVFLFSVTVVVRKILDLTKRASKLRTFSS